MSKVNRILLIDDDYATNFMNKIMITKAGICENVEVVLTANDGLEYLQSRSQNANELPEIIFLDINMPEMTGWEFLNAYDGLPDSIKNKIKIYMLSSSQSEEDVKMANSNKHVAGFLHKPLHIDFLKSTFS